MDKSKVITLLLKDMEDEHGAIIQYLGHAYAMGEGEMACEIEAVARDEMRHLDWLAETIVELGGTPSLEKGTMLPGGKAVPDWMGNDVLLEEGAITQYRAHIEAVDDPAIKRLLQRILADEESHRGSFAHFVDKAGKEGARDLRGNRQDDTTRALSWGFEHEYTVVLQYLFHSYMTRNMEARKQLEDQAINEMQHMGWLGEKLVSGGGAPPTVLHPRPDMSTKTADMLRADIGIEDEVTAEYERINSKVKEPDLKKLFRRMRENEIYHASVFRDLLKKEEGK